jgi:aspartyl protease family protein
VAVAAVAAVGLGPLTALHAATAVSLAGVSGDKALLVVGSQPPRFVAVGQTVQGVQLLAVEGSQATVQVDGHKLTLRLGEAPVSVGNGGGGIGDTQVVLFANGQGHYLATGSVNGQAVQFLVDTGATMVTLGRSDALRMGIQPGQGSGKKTRTYTANGMSEAWQTQLDSVRVGSVEVLRVNALIMPHDMPVALLGNSFLKHFKMHSDTEQLVLERRR